MSDVENWLLLTRLRAIRARLEAASDPSTTEAVWRAAERDLAAAGAQEDAAAALPILERALPELDALLDGWQSKSIPLTEWDQAVLKRAMNAFKKRLKITRADDEYSSSRNPMSHGATSSITGVRPPEAYTADIWELLVAHGRLNDPGDGNLESAASGPA